MFTKQHYEAIAKIINDLYPELPTQGTTKGTYTEKQELVASTLTELAEKLAEYLWNDNPRFNEDKFLAACFKNS